MKTMDVKDTLRSFGWECGPDFDKRYYTDPWVFNLVNIIERQAGALRRIEEAYDESKTGDPNNRDEQYQNLLDLATTVRKVFDNPHQTDEAGRHLPDCWCV